MTWSAARDAMIRAYAHQQQAALAIEEASDIVSRLELGARDSTQRMVAASLAASAGVDSQADIMRQTAEAFNEIAALTGEADAW